MKRIARIGLLLALMAAPIPANAAPEVSSREATPASDEDCGGFPNDITTIDVADGGSLIASMTFCPGYGRTKEQIVDLGKGGLYVLVQYRQGHGTGANEFLTVYRVKTSFVEVL